MWPTWTWLEFFSIPIDLTWTWLIVLKTLSLQRHFMCIISIDRYWQSMKARLGSELYPCSLRRGELLSPRMRSGCPQEVEESGNPEAGLELLSRGSPKVLHAVRDALQGVDQGWVRDVVESTWVLLGLGCWVQTVVLAQTQAPRPPMVLDSRNPTEPQMERKYPTGSPRMVRPSAWSLDENQGISRRKFHQVTCKRFLKRPQIQGRTT